MDILSSEEKLLFSAHVSTLRALGLTYVKDDGSFNYYKSTNESSDIIRLEPEIDKLVRFADISESFFPGRKDIPPLLKELLAHGATVAVLRDRESEAKMAKELGEKAAPKEKKTGQHQENVAPLPPEKLTKQNGSNNQVAKNFLGIRAAKAKEAKTARRAARVGFDRSKKIKLSNTGSGAELSTVIRFKYQKGFTQAVRAPCQLEDLL